MSNHIRTADGREHAVTAVELARLKQEDRDGGGRPYPGHVAVYKDCGAVVRWITTEIKEDKKGAVTGGKQVPVAPFPLPGNWHWPLWGYGPERTDGRPPETFGTLYVFPANEALARASGWKGGAVLFRDPPPTVWGYRPHHADSPTHVRPSGHA